MPPDASAASAPHRVVPDSPWFRALVCLALGCALLFALTLTAWREMAHQWWDIDTYAHIVLIPPILGWLAWLRRNELAAIAPSGWVPGLAFLAGGLAIWLGGERAGINLFAQVGAVIALQGAVLSMLGLRAGLMLAFPLLYALFLVPFGDEIVRPLQDATARIAVALTHASGVPATIDGLFIDTPAGRFVVAEECSGVKFLIAMIALATLAAWTAFCSWRRRAAFLVAAAFLSIVANGIRAWATIYVAQFVGAERAGGFDHIVYGWVFFAAVIGMVLAGGWRFVEREPSEAGMTAPDADRLAGAIGGREVAPEVALAWAAGAAIAFAVLAQVV